MQERPSDFPQKSQRILSQQPSLEPTLGLLPARFGLGAQTPGFFAATTDFGGDSLLSLPLGKLNPGSAGNREVFRSS